MNQNKTELKYVAAGLCRRCGRVREDTTRTYCAACRDYWYQIKYQERVAGWKRTRLYCPDCQARGRKVTLVRDQDYTFCDQCAYIKE